MVKKSEIKQLLELQKGFAKASFSGKRTIADMLNADIVNRVVGKYPVFEGGALHSAIEYAAYQGYDEQTVINALKALHIEVREDE